MKKIIFLCVFSFNYIMETQSQSISKITSELNQLVNLKSDNIFPDNLKIYTAQMHLHGYSNHNGSQKPGSLQWHTKFADSTKTDIIWWTDHRDMFLQNFLFTFKFTNGVYDVENNIITGLAGNILNPTKWIGGGGGGVVAVQMDTDTLAIQLTDTLTSTNPIFVSFVPRGTKGSLRGVQRFCRPITSHPIFSFNLSANDLSFNSNNHISLEFYLSYHLYDGVVQQKLIYNFIQDTVALNYQLLDSNNLIINYPIQQGNNDIQLDIENDAQFLKDGKDNVIQDLKIILKTKNNNTLSTKFSNFQLVSIITADSVNYQKMNNYLLEYKSKYPVQQIIGTEITISNDEETHLNGYLPDTVSQSTMYFDVPELNIPAIVVPAIHQVGGVVSFNHPFGTGFEVDYLNQDFRVDTMAQYLLNNNAFGCDILEVGYIQRGGVDIQHHMKLWDILTANQLYMYGNGVSDMHGGDWTNNPINFNTYLWAKDSTATSLIESIKKGRFYFGDERIYKDNFIFGLDSALMGDRTLAKSIEAPLNIDINNIPENAYFKLSQGLLQPGLEVTYLYNDSIIDWQDPPCLSLSNPCFIRLAMFIGEDPIFYSNPIIFTGQVPNPITSLCSVDYIPKTKVDNAEYLLFPTIISTEFTLSITAKEACKYKISIIDNEGKYIKYLGEFKVKSGENIKNISNLKLAQGNYFLLMETEFVNKTLSFFVTK